MVKQSLGLPSANYRLRPDTRLHVLHYPQRSIVGTDAMEATKFLQRPGGQNYVVAVMSLHGYNMQDAVIMNRASVERALGQYKSELERDMKLMGCKTIKDLSRKNLRFRR